MKTVRVFVASPSDLRSERELVKRVLADLNSATQFRDNTKFIPYLYEDAAPAVVGPEAQVVVDEFMLRPEDADIVICMFWNRLGTPVEIIDPETGCGYESGTVYELLKSYRQFRDRGAPIVLLYRCVREATLSRADSVESLRVDALFERFSKYGELHGLVGQFASAEDFSWTLRAHLLSAVDRYGRRERQARLRMLFADHGGFIQDRLARFVGRAAELRAIGDLIAERTALGGYITITGRAGQGKSSLIARLVADAGVDTVAHHFIPINPGPDHQVSLLRNLMARLIHKYDLPELYLTSDSRPLTRDFFPKVLSEVSQRGGHEVIFIDGLDQLPEEANGDRDLSFLPLRLPPGIVCVLGTRPNDTLKPLQLLDPHHEYALPALSRNDFKAILSRRGVKLDELIVERFYMAMEANALYLDLVAKELAEGGHVATGTVVQRLANNPGGIFSLSIERLRQQRSLWDAAVRPFLGILSVAQEPLAERAIRSLLRIDADTLQIVLQRLGGLIDREADGRYHLFHLKFTEYLRPSENGQGEAHLFDADEMRAWHDRVVAWCESGSSELEEIWLESVEATEQSRRVYAREHYVSHLFHAKRWTRLTELLDRGSFGREKLRYDPSTRSYGRDLVLGCKALLRSASSDDERRRCLPVVWRYSLLRCSLATKARNYRDELFTALVLSGRSTEALELVDLMLTTERRVSALCRVAQALTHESSRYAVAPILFRAEQIAEGIRDIWSYSRAFNLLLQAVLAGRDWDEAIRIAYRFGDARERIEALGTVVLAMAAAGESVRMHEVIVRCLDLAKRIGYRVALDQPFRMAIGADMSTSPTAVLSGPTPTGATNESLAMAFSVLVSIGRGDVDKAGSVSHRIHNPALEVMTLVELARYWAATGSETAAKPLLESLPAILERISDPISKTDCLIAISLLLAQIGDRSRAIELLSAASNASSNSGHMTVLDDLPSRVSAVAGLAEDVWALGNPGTAVTILEQAIQMTRGGPNREHRQTCLRNIADIASTMGRDELAGELLVEAGGAPLALFEDIDAVLEMLNRAGDVKGAVDLLVSDRYLDNLIKKKAWDDAIDFARSETSKKAPYDATLNEKTWPHTRSVPETAAATELKQQLYLQKRATRSLTVVRGLIRAGERSRAHALVSETLPLLPQIAEASVRATTMAASAEAVAQLGDVSVTVNLIHETLDLSQVLAIGDQLDVLNVLVLAAQQVGQVGVAISIIERLTMIVSAAPDSASKARALRYVVRALARVKSSARLQEIIQTEWMQLETRDELIALLPLASPLVVDGSVGAYLTSSFEWVDEFVSIT